jgi:diacylglycerol kinase (ATP)
MRAAAIFGLGCSQKNLKPFQIDSSIEWHIGLPSAGDRTEVVLLFGGDGTIHRHLNQLVKLESSLLVVPTGSGNDFARALGLRHVRDSLAAWWRFVLERDNVRAIDLGTITPLNASAAESPAPHDPIYFCSVAGVGLDSEVARRANGLPRWLRGHGGYALAATPTIFRFAPLPMKIYTANNACQWSIRSDQPTLLAAFANTATYGGGMRIAPNARMDDGLLDVCVIGGMDPFKLACMFPTVYFGRHLRVREVKYLQTARVRVETGKPLDIYADGEFVCRTPVEVGVRPGALKVLMPSPRC